MCLAVPGEIVSIEEGEQEIERSGTVDFSGTRKEVNLAYVPDAEVGDYVLVHVGFAIQTVDEEEAGHVFEYLEEIGEIDAFKEELEEAENEGASEGVEANSS